MTCYICKNEGLIHIYNAVLDLKKQEEEYPELAKFTSSDYISYMCSGTVFTVQRHFDYYSQKMRIIQATSLKFRNQMNVVADGPCSTEHADMIEVLAKEKCIAIKPRAGELFGNLDSWGKDWRKGF